MRALLIAPAERPHVTALWEVSPLANLPILGKCLIEYWLEHLAASGAKKVSILAADRPEQVRRLVGDGARWGLDVEVVPECRELTPDEARGKYLVNGGGDWLPAPNDARVMDHLPESPGHPLFASYAVWYAAQQAWLPRAMTPDRIGVREAKPGVWVGMRSRISTEAELRAPCWIGEDVYVGPRAVVGPEAILESRIFVEAGAEISYSIVGPETFIGELTETRDSIACGNRLINWRDGSSLDVPDAFTLAALGRRSPPAASWPARLAALLVMVLSLPIALLAAMRAKLNGQKPLRRLQGVRPMAPSQSTRNGVYSYYDLQGMDGLVRRWPQLWNVARGDFAWVGNRPLDPGQAAWLVSDFERLWLATPVGLISLADAEGCGEVFNDETRAHASYYAAQASRRLNWSILRRVITRLLFNVAGVRTQSALPPSARSALSKQES